VREEHRVFQNTVLRKIFGTKRNEVTGGWRRIHNEELHDQIKVNDMVGACGTYGRQKRCIENFRWKT
jgi:hypothetical protein